MKNHLLIICLLALIWGCNSNKEHRASTADISESKIDTLTDPKLKGKIIKTADAQFKVKDVRKTNRKLDSIANQMGGYISKSSLTSRVRETTVIELSRDSLQEVSSYYVQADITVKVPSAQLNHFMLQVGDMASFVDSQNLSLEDVSLQYMENKLKAQNRVAAVEDAGQLAKKKVSNAEAILNIKDDITNKAIGNMSIDAKVAYSTVSLSVYQDNAIMKTTRANDNLSNYKAGFFDRSAKAFLVGWGWLLEALLVIMHLWGFIAGGILIWFIYRFYKKKKGVAVPQ